MYSGIQVFGVRLQVILEDPYMRTEQIHEIPQKTLISKRFSVSINSGHLPSLLCQGIKVVSQFLKQSFFYQSFDNIEDPGPGFRIIAAGLKQRVQVQRVFFPRCKASQYFFCKLVHGGTLLSVSR